MPCRSRIARGLWAGLLWAALSVSEASVTHYVSFGMPVSRLKAQLRVAGQGLDDTVLFRGFPESMGYSEFIQKLMPLIRDLPKEKRPHIGIDPRAFELNGILKVPVSLSLGQRDEGSARYPVTEPDPRTRMQRLLAGVTPDRWRAELMRTPIAQPSAPLPLAHQEDYHRIEPSFHLPTSLESPDGRVLVKAGTTLNPLALWPAEKPFLVMAIEDEQSITSVQKRYKALDGHAHLLASGLNPGEMDARLEAISRKFQAPVYPLPRHWLDRLRMTSVPAEVRAKGTVLEIRQWPP